MPNEETTNNNGIASIHREIAEIRTQMSIETNKLHEEFMAKFSELNYRIHETTEMLHNMNAQVNNLYQSFNEVNQQLNVTTQRMDRIGLAFQGD